MISEDFVNKYEAQGLANKDLTGSLTAEDLQVFAGDVIAAPFKFATSAVADIGVSLFNSAIAIPKLWGSNTDEYKADTYDLLKGVNEDVASFYSRNQESVNTASFIGGLVLPLGAAFKGMKLLQSGKVGFYPTVLTDLRQTERINELQSMVELGGKATTEYRNLRWSLLAANAGQETLQAVGAELAVIGALSAHPFMEDYLKEPVKNFFLWAAVGGVIGTGMGQIATRHLLASSIGKVETEAVDVVIGKLIDIPAVAISNVDLAQRHNSNISILRGIAEDTSNKPITRQYASDALRSVEGTIGELEVDKIFHPTLRAAKSDVKQAARDVMLTDDAFGANSVDLMTYDTREFVTANKGRMVPTISQEQATATSQKYERLWNAGYRVRSALIASEGIKGFTPDWARLMKEEFKVGYSPFHKVWVPQSEIPFYTRAVDTGQATWQKVKALKIDVDASFNFGRNVPSAVVDKNWVDTLGTVANATLEKNIYVAAGDIAVQNAWLSRLSTLSAEGKSLPKVFLVADTVGEATQSALKAQGKEVSLIELEQNLQRQKESQIRSLLMSGASSHEIGIKLNMPTGTVERFLAERKPLNELGDWRLYTDAGKIESDYLGQKTRMLQFITDGKRTASLKYRNADMSANLDSKAIRQYNHEYMAGVIASGNSDMYKELFQVLSSDAKEWAIFEAQLGNVVNSKLGSVFLNSADMASRRMGDISGTSVRKGQELIGLLNNISRERLTNVSSKLRSITQTQVGLNEFNKIANIRNSTDGYMGFDEVTGQLYRKVEHEPGVFMKQPLRFDDGSLAIMSEPMSDFMRTLTPVLRELYETKNVLNRIQGYKDLNDIGIWMPTFNPTNKFISYVIDKQAVEGTSKVKVIVGKSPEDLASLERDWSSKYGAQKERYDLVTKSQQEDYNFWAMRQDPIEMDHADITKFHSGASGSALPVVGDEYASTLIEQLHHRYIHYGRKMQEMVLSDIMQTLDLMSGVNQKFFKDQPTAARSIGLAQREDAALFIKNTILGNNQLNQFTAWAAGANSFSTAIEWASRKVTDTYRGLRYTDKTQRVLKEGEFVRIDKELKEHGVRNPFAGSYDDYLITRESAKESSELYSKMSQVDNEFSKLFDKYRKDFESDLTIQNIERYREKVYRDFGKELPIDVRAIIDSRGGIKGFQEAFDEAFEGARAASGGQKIVDQMETLRVQEVQRKLSVPYSKAEEIVAANNGILATVALRVLETGQAAITAMSWPIMMLPEFYRAFPKTYLGNAAGEGIHVAFPARAIYDGMRFRHSDMAKPLIKQWIDQGYGKSIVSEASSINTLLSVGGTGAAGKIQKFLESDIIRTLSKPSDFMESETRLWILSTFYQAAKRIYPGISSEAASSFAKEKLVVSIGNYYSAQRPAMFQGTFGVAIGLFQTYMLSWGQSMYRSIEERAGKAIAAQMLSQAGLFGMSSLPLYDQFSKFIGSHMSDKHYDLQSGTYRAFPDPMAEFVVYGLPASLGVGLYTRGDMQPRLPFVGQQNIEDTFAAVNVAKQVIGAGGHMISNVFNANGMADKARGLMEGIAMQSLSRPLARIAEIVPLPDGEGGMKAVGSVSRAGNTISTSDEVWSGPGLASRIFASRSTEEQVKREVDYLNTFYGALDRDNRKRATETLKSSIRSGQLNEETLTKTATEYLRTGTATGWKAALNEAFATAEGGLDYRLGKTLRPDSPLLKMIDENY